MDSEDRMRSEAYIIVLLATILLLGGLGIAKLPVFSGSPATGFAVLNTGVPEEEADASAQDPNIGSSRSPASFSLDLLYDFSDYAVIRQQVLGVEKEKGLVDLIRECAGDSDECSAAAVLEINKREGMKSAGLTMVDGPCDQRENVWSDAVEGIGACLALAKGDCACPVTLSRSPAQDGSDKRADDPIPIIAEKGDGMTKISLDDLTLPLEYSFDSEISGYAFTLDSSTGIFFLKREGAGLSFADGPGLLPECAAIRTHRKICVRSDRKIPVLNPFSEKTEMMQMEYKFAVELADAVAPQKALVPAVEPADASGAGSSPLIISFLQEQKNSDGSELTDLAGFRFYYSADDFSTADENLFFYTVSSTEGCKNNQCSFTIPDKGSGFYAAAGFDRAGNIGKEVSTAQLK